MITAAGYGAVALERAREREVPAHWDARLREVSPIVSYTSHLRFRWMPLVEQWALYQCVPAHLLAYDRVQQFRHHWSELPKAQQMGRKMSVSDYQFRMFHDFKVDARKMWILQGSDAQHSGGTPARYTDLERKILHASNMPTEVIPAGTLPYLPFDERVVHALRQRDRLVQVGLDVERLRALDSVDGMRQQAEETEQAFRKQFLDWMKTAMKPQGEFLTWFLRKKEADRLFRRATQDEAKAAATYRDQYITHGSMPLSR